MLFPQKQSLYLTRCGQEALLSCRNSTCMAIRTGCSLGWLLMFQGTGNEAWGAALRRKWPEPAAVDTSTTGVSGNEKRERSSQFWKTRAGKSNFWDILILQCQLHVCFARNLFAGGKHPRSILVLQCPKLLCGNQFQKKASLLGADLSLSL